MPVGLASLVGCSMDGAAVIDFALEYPERVSELEVRMWVDGPTSSEDPKRAERREAPG